MKTVQRWIDSILGWRGQGFGAGRLMMNAGPTDVVSGVSQVDPQMPPTELPPAAPSIQASSHRVSGAAAKPHTCSTCGNEYDKVFQVIYQGKEFAFDSVECAAHILAPVCAHCGCRILGHGVESDGLIFCCDHCVRHERTE